MDAYQLEELSRDECLRLLRAGVVGWVAFPDDDGASLVPVNYLVHHGETVVLTDYGSKLAAAAQERVMSLGVGEFDPATRSGWSVVVRGRSLLVGDDLVNVDLPEVTSWAVRGRGIRIAIGMDEISGRRLVAAGGGPAPA